MKNVVFWDVAPCKSSVNRHFDGTSVDTICTRRHNPEDGILQSHRRENLKFYKAYENLSLIYRSSDVIVITSLYFIPLSIECGLSLTMVTRY
jgi:hypothetical protein